MPTDVVRPKKASEEDGAKKKSRPASSGNVRSRCPGVVSLLRHDGLLDQSPHRDKFLQAIEDNAVRRRLDHFKHEALSRSSTAPSQPLADLAFYDLRLQHNQWQRQRKRRSRPGSNLDRFRGGGDGKGGCDTVQLGSWRPRHVVPWDEQSSTEQVKTLCHRIASQETPGGLAKADGEVAKGRSEGTDHDSIVKGFKEIFQNIARNALDSPQFGRGSTFHEVASRQRSIEAVGSERVHRQSGPRNSLPAGALL